MWKFQAEDMISSECVVWDIDGDNKQEVVFGSIRNYIYAINSEDASILWKFKVDARSWLAMGDLDCDGKPEIVAPTVRGAYALNGENGSILWHFRVQQGVFSPSLGDLDSDGKLEVIFGSLDGHVYALNGEDGSLLWKRFFNALVGASIALGDVDGDNRLEAVFGAFNGYVYTLNGEDGFLLWSFNTMKRWVGGSISIGDVDGDNRPDVVVAAFGEYNNSSIFALNGKYGFTLWEFSFLLGTDFSIPAIGDINGDGVAETVFGALNHNVYCLSGKDGSLLWKFQTGQVVSNPPALGDIDGDNKLDVLIASYDGYLYALNGSDGTLLWRYWIGKSLSSSILADLDGDGDLEIVVGNNYGVLYALDVRNAGFRVYWQSGSGDVLFMRWNNQLFADRDGDFLSDYSEVYLGSDPLNPDTDSDGYKDGFEVSHDTDPLDPSDHPVSSNTASQNVFTLSIPTIYWVSLLVLSIAIVAFLSTLIFVVRRRSSSYFSWRNIL